MKRLFALILAPLVLAAGCSEDEDILPAQKDKIVSYLKGTHTPNLVAEADVEEGSNQPYYTVSGDAVYRYIQDLYNPDRVNWTEVTGASTVTVTFRAYVFNYANIVTTGSTMTMPYYTNDPVLKAAFEQAGLNTEWWSFEPLTIDMKHPGILKGLSDALLGCREGDTVEAYMTYNMAYGDDHFGIIPKESPVAWFFTVNSVE
ncbi:FKBP-type peptidyl-prolyl cis-trans isomerase [uncultured Alistipes sp.]|uniref:FKBP-type peptidyl-prolyl cis-trans isomerase n=1 Tax=uncultured Alistipes sp. TaxID=538949 RepID=UPI0025FB06BB|nr:FKBP-type peptidyl-prolyl cis-trans isomerase [uncultured Alistipes sp.]